jgi:hypothetical protein
MSSTDRPTSQWISIHLLDCDGDNPRFRREVDNGRDAVREVYRRRTAEEQLELAQDILENGLSPIEPILVTAGPKAENEKTDHQVRYIVLEGNRRVSVIKSLAAPEIVEDLMSRPQYARLVGLSRAYDENIPRQVNCVIVGDRAAAAPWLSKRHVPGKGARGKIPWDTIEQERFARRYEGVESPTLKLLEMVADFSKAFDMSNTKFNYTNMTRLFQTPVIRRVLGVDEERSPASMNGKHLRILGPEIEVLPLWEYIVQLIADDQRFSVNMIRRKEDQCKFVSNIPLNIMPCYSKMSADYRSAVAAFEVELGARLNLRDRESIIVSDAVVEPVLAHKAADVPGKQGVNPPTLLETVRAKPSKDEGKAQHNSTAPSIEAQTTVPANVHSNGGRLKKTKPPHRRDTLVPPDLQLDVAPERVVHIVYELKSLKVDQYPNACVALFRLLLEISVNELAKMAEFKPTGENVEYNSFEDKTLLAKTSICIEHLAKQRYLDRGQASAARHLTNDKGRGIDILHVAQHHSALVVDPNSLRIMWDNASHFFVAIWNKYPRPPVQGG